MIPLFAGASHVAAAIRAKTISASELVRRTFERIDSINPSLNAIVWQDRDAALVRAQEADRALEAGSECGPLHGVPVIIKESFAYRGSPNAWGLPALKDAISPRTAVAVERLEAAGAIVVGKTNVPVMLGDWQTYNPIHGVTNNPWDVSRTCGGSTGGGAAAVAAGLGCLALGSDLSGSIRIPAHFCGVYGHKPSLNLASADGFQPGPWDGTPGYPMDVSVVGPLARDARDLALALSVLGGADGDDAKAWTWRMPPPRHTRLDRFRIGYLLDAAAGPIASDVAAVYEGVLSELARTGASLTRGWPAGFDMPSQLKTFEFLVTALVTADSEKSPPHGRWLHETQRRLALRANWRTYFESHDVFLLPAAPVAAFPHDHSEPIGKRRIPTVDGPRSYMDLPYWISVASVAGLPATVAPVGLTAAGLPVGIQIVAPMWEDATSIEFAALLADVVGGFEPPPLT